MPVGTGWRGLQSRRVVTRGEIRVAKYDDHPARRTAPAGARHPAGHRLGDTELKLASTG